jgi:hypothetical protein
MKENHIIFALVFMAILGTLNVVKPGVEQPAQNPAPNIQWLPPTSPPQTKPQSNIKTPIPSYLPYEGIVRQLNVWNQEAPDLAEQGIVGKTSRGKDIHYLRITNEFNGNKPKILITGCIHGNEPHATATVMAYLGTLLSGYGKDAEITEILDTREIYFVPVVSPDSYPDSRYVDGVDPNRDFKNLKAAPVRAIQEFFQKHKFKAALSGHTWGRVFLIPPGNAMQNCPDHEKYKTIVGEMARLSGYRWMRACDLYNGNGGLNNPPIRWGDSDWNMDLSEVPIYGTEVDWYYQNGAFAVVMEFGTHQRLPTVKEIQDEFNMTWSAFRLFLKKATLED